MARLDILEHPDPRLRVPCTPVSTFDDGLDSLIEDMLDTMNATSSIGLSAPQVNDTRQVLIIDNSNDASDPQIFINPEITGKSAWGLVEESCLSLPGVTGNVLRATEIRVAAQDRNGNAFERDLSAMDAVCLQHELDHLHGKLFIDRLSFFRRLRLRLQGVELARGKAAA